MRPSPILLASLACLTTLIMGSSSRPETEQVVRAGEAPSYVIAGGKGVAKLFVNATTGAKDAAVSHLTLLPGAAVPAHTHENSSEILYIETGEVEMSIAGRSYRAGAGDVVYVPAGVLHSARVASRFKAIEAVQIYVGPGPEQRFVSGKAQP